MCQFAAAILATDLAPRHTPLVPADAPLDKTAVKLGVLLEELEERYCS